MFIKLRFSTATNPYQLFKIFDWCINNRPATGSNLATQLTAAGYTQSSLIDQTNTQIWNSGTGITALTANTVSKFTKTSATTFTYDWYVEQQAYDNANTRHVTRVSETSATTLASANGLFLNYWSTAGTMISGITAESLASQNYGVATTGGSGSLSGQTGGTSYNNVFSTGQISNGITGAVLFVTDTCLLWFCTGGGLITNNGFVAGSNATSTTYMKGIYLTTQYTRTDAWNTSSSLIPPWVWSGIDSTLSPAASFMSTANKFQSTQNVGYTALKPTNHLHADRILNNNPTTINTTQPYLSEQGVNVGAGHNRFDDTLGFTSTSGTQSTQSTTTTQCGAIFPSTAGSRFLSADLKTMSYALIPFTWACRYYNCTGGSITDRAGLYWFSGDYFPGDTLVYNSKTYILFNGCIDQNNRIALAVPRE